jgi:hypothetical protein
MTENETLEKLYNDHFTDLIEPLKSYNQHISDKELDSTLKATNPLMLKTKDDWCIADLKIMIYGQETNFWGKECGNNAAFCGKVNNVINVYDTFYLQNKMYNSPFWNEFRRIKKHFQKTTKTAVLWNNVIKIGRQGIGNLPQINQITKAHFNVLAQEINIINPDLIVFFTGPNYDKFILEYLGKFEKVKYAEFDVNQICEIKFDTDYGTKKVLRINHPNFLYRNKTRKVIMDKVLAELDSAL